MTRQRRRPTFVGWAMLLVVLISAVPTTGQARTRLIGSAFDPATYSVVVSPKKPRVTGSKTSLDRKTPLDHLFDGTPIQVVVAGPVPILPALVMVAGLSYDTLSAEPDSHFHSTRANGPRAPPAA